MRDVVVLGVGMHAFGKHPDKSLYDLARVAVWNAIRDSGIDPRWLTQAYVANSLAGPLQGLENIRGHFIHNESRFLCPSSEVLLDKRKSGGRRIIQHSLLEHPVVENLFFP